VGQVKRVLEKSL